MVRVFWSAAIVLAGGLVCSSAAAAPPVGDFDAPTPVQHIYGGENTLTCEWPSAVEVGGCTGTLVHPEVVIYAGHCGGNVGQVFFGESVYSGGGRSVGTQFCTTKPGWSPGAGTDFAVCKLAQPVTDVQITPILMGCETEVLEPGREVVLVGFGQTETGGSGVKKEVVTTLDHVANNEAFLGGGGLAPCYGDSGGPAFVKLPAAEGYDDTWRVFGVTSHGDQQCGGGGYYGMMHNAIDWFESETGVDITPCHDADGTWNPGPDCYGFPTAPGTTSGSWNDWCTAGPVGGPSETCGDANADLETDETPPTVRIEAPADGDDFDSDFGDLEVMVTATDDDGVAEVSIAVDGAPLPGDATAPYAFVVNLADGEHTITATATDHSGNASAPDSVTVSIGGAPGDGDGGGNGGDGAGGDDDDDDDDDDGSGGGLDSGGNPVLPPGFGQYDEASGCSCRSESPAVSPALLLLLGFARRRRRC